jgi:ubiquinone/menaquinone biosynthesis C-methylase UbiE
MVAGAVERFVEERARTQRFFNRTWLLYPLVERHLFPQYREVLARLALRPDLSVLDLATGTGMLAGAFAERGHVVTGLDFADRLLVRARRRFPRVRFDHLDLVNLDQVDTGAYDVVCMGYVLHGLSAGFRRYILNHSARIAAQHVLIVDYGCRGSWLIRLIERVEGPHYPEFVATDFAQELGRAGLRTNRFEQVSEIGNYWLCSPGI